MVHRLPPLGENGALGIGRVRGDHVFEAALFPSRSAHRLDTRLDEPVPLLGVERELSLHNHNCHLPFIGAGPNRRGHGATLGWGCQCPAKLDPMAEPWTRAAAASARFAAQADEYDRFRPRYPAGLFVTLLREAELDIGDVVVEIGAGTDSPPSHSPNAGSACMPSNQLPSWPSWRKRNSEDKRS